MAGFILFDRLFTRVRGMIGLTNKRMVTDDLFT